jgi:hypothetical protein
MDRYLPARLHSLCGTCPASGQTCGGQRDMQRLLDYWDAKRGTRALPARRDIDPLELSSLLPHIFLIDVLDQARHFRFRLSGTEVDHIYRRSMQGKAPADIASPRVAGELEAQIRAVLAQRRPNCAPYLVRGADHTTWRFERLLMPLSSDGEGIDMLMGGLFDGARLAIC